MKTFKIIMNCVVSVLLVISVVLNIFLLSGFEFVKKDKDSGTKDYIDYRPNYNESVDKNYDDSEGTSTSTEQTDSKENEVINEVVYEDVNIKVTYCGIKEDTDELTYLFKIENQYSKPINVTFDDLYINGQRVYISGLTCEKLLPGTSKVEDFVLKESECDQNPKNENEFVFNIKLMNAKSYLDIYETEPVTVVI